MLTVQYPPTQVTVHVPPIVVPPLEFPVLVRGFRVDRWGFIISEMMLPASIIESGFVTAYLPPMKQPRWNGERWMETAGWYRALWRAIQARFQ